MPSVEIDGLSTRHANVQVASDTDNLGSDFLVLMGSTSVLALHLRPSAPVPRVTTLRKTSFNPYLLTNDVMDKILLSSLPHLTDFDKATLQKVNATTVADLVLTPIRRLAKKGSRVSPPEITRLIQAVCSSQRSLAFTFRTLEDVQPDVGRMFSVGDPVLDEALGGGLRTGMIWEIVGESAAGKTQIALQSSLYVQLPQVQGGLGGSTCYLTTSLKLQTPRLLQILQTRNLSDASLEDVHTLSTPTVHILLKVLEDQLPTFIETTAKTPLRKPVKLLVIDALAELFHLVEKVSTASLVERSQQLTRVSALLHRLAEKYKIAVVVLNEVVDAFHNDAIDYERSENGLLLYSGQAKWFNRGHSVYGEDMKEASLGLVWANQVNVRVMLTRTGRRRYVEEETTVEDGDKRQKMEGEEDSGLELGAPAGEQEPLLIRRLTVIFNSAATPISCDYIITPAGVKGLPNEDRPVHIPVQEQHSRIGVTGLSSPSNSLPNLLWPGVQPISQSVIPSSQDEEYDNLWADDDFYENVDWVNLEQTLTQAQGPNN